MNGDILNTEQKLSKTEFTKSAKAKSPEYSDMDDGDLVFKIIVIDPDGGYTNQILEEFGGYEALKNLLTEKSEEQPGQTNETKGVAYKFNEYGRRSI